MIQVTPLARAVHVNPDNGSRAALITPALARICAVRLMQLVESSKGEQLVIPQEADIEGMAMPYGHAAELACDLVEAADEADRMCVVSRS